jgi:hypothetical protein
MKKKSLKCQELSHNFNNKKKMHYLNHTIKKTIIKRMEKSNSKKIIRKIKKIKEELKMEECKKNRKKFY